MPGAIGAQAPKAGKPRSGALNRLFASVAVAVLLALAGCRHAPPEQALRDTIAAMQAAAEAHDTDSLFAPIAEDFAGSEGMDRQQFRRYVTFAGMRQQKIGVRLGQLDVKLYGERASVSFTAALTGGVGWLPEEAQVYAVDTGWRLESGQWKLISARWKPQL